jgi:outer membrane murein-binding lipoprotein Lpp
MTVGKASISLSQIATGIGLLVSFAGIVTTWSLMQYRLDQIEKELSTLQTQVSQLESDSAAQADEVKCLICRTHSIPCPGC